MEAMKVPLDERTYCAHHYIYYNTCRNSVWPLAYRCAKEKHAYEKCLYEEVTFIVLALILDNIYWVQYLWMVFADFSSFLCEENKEASEDM
ncbi:NADH dehydrogenase [ubiquinone] 1 beta subcomplex subunit 7 [Armadillidium vulgare]|nr:NADH dehydrogenase [ubiquinone] 1 beta subcomplex subunit 7 [Armadillidium vulgare]